jgi:tetratricopeptide (TPR) repeat protein
MTDFISLVNQARQLFDEQKYSEATKLYYNSLDHSHNDEEKATVWAELCWCYYKLKSFKQVIEAGVKVLEFDKLYEAKADLYRLMGYSYFALENDDRAEKFLLKSIEEDYESDKQKYVCYELGKLYFRNHKYSDAIKYLEMTEAFFKNQAKEYWISMLFFKGFSHYYQQNLVKAASIFQELIDNTEDPILQSNGYYGMAYVEFEQKNYLNTINICEKITRLNPNFFDKESLGFMMAAAFYYLGRYDVFSQYYFQMQKSFKGGRYLEELSRMEAQIPKPPQEPLN